MNTNICVLTKNKLISSHIHKYFNKDKVEIIQLIIWDKDRCKTYGVILHNECYYDKDESKFMTYPYKIYKEIIPKWLTLYLSLQCHFGDLHHDLFYNIAIYYIPLYFLI